MATVVMTYPRDGGTYGTNADGGLVPFVATGYVDVPGQVVSVYEDATSALLGSVAASATPDAAGEWAGWYPWAIPITGWTTSAGAHLPAMAGAGSMAAPSLAGTHPFLPMAGAGSMVDTDYVGATAFSVPVMAGRGTAVTISITAVAGLPAMAGAGACATISLTAAADTTAPTMTAFTLGTPVGLNVKAATLTATDAVGVTGYLLTESATPPSAGSGNWQAASYWTTSDGYTFASGGAKTLWAWAKDAAGNVSAVYASRDVTVTADGISLASSGAEAALTDGIPIPSGLAANDIVVVIAGTRDSVNISAPSGWTKKQPAAAGRVSVFWKRTAGSESPPSWAATLGVGRAFAFRGCVTSGDPFEASNYATSATDTASTSTTTLTANTLLLLAASGTASDTEESDASAIMNAPTGPATTEQWKYFEEAGGGSTASTVALWTGPKVTAGATGTATASFYAYMDALGISVALLALKKA